MRAAIRTLSALVLCLLTAALPARGEAPPPGAFWGLPDATLFALPRILRDLSELPSGQAEADLRARLRGVDEILAAHPGFGRLHLLRAALLLDLGDPDAADAALAEAARHPAPGLLDALDAGGFAALDGRDGHREAYSRLLTTPEPPPPGPASIADGIAPVGAANTYFDPRAGRFTVRLSPPERPSGLPVLLGEPGDDAERLLARLVARGLAAGHDGDVYDNRDRGHSQLAFRRFPQLARTVYGAEARAADLDYGLATGIVFTRPTFGNSSTAITAGALPRSQPRLALTRPGGAQALWADYTANQIYVYPEHRDHDTEQGDLFPANTPYMLISQGSSGSDKPHLRAVAMILAAFRPDTKDMLVRTGLLAPTVQMVFRRGQRGIGSRAAYLGGAAHPTVFPARVIDLPRMVGLANALLPGEVPPVVRLRMLSEPRMRAGRDYLDRTASERLFDTPSAIARLWRAHDHSRELVLSAGDTRDPNGRALRFEWVLLRGDPDRVRITPLDPAGTTARIGIDWHDRRVISPAQPIPTDRVDIGVFADNGAQLSAPAFLSLSFPTHQRRSYAAGPDGDMRIERIDHRRAAGRYVDPVLFATAPWADRYTYLSGGEAAGWVRTHADGRTERFDAAGRLVAVDGQPLPAPRVGTHRPVPPLGAGRASDLRFFPDTAAEGDAGAGQ